MKRTFPMLAALVTAGAALVACTSGSGGSPSSSSVSSSPVPVPVSSTTGPVSSTMSSTLTSTASAASSLAPSSLAPSSAASSLAPSSAPAPSSAVPPADAPLTVTTTSGRLQGVATKAVREFLGVRYALPPTGTRRWTDPEPAPPGEGLVPATRPGADCAQAGAATSAGSSSVKSSGSEDCLFLNVTTPRQLRTGEKLPVMVWWHGGGYTSGAGSAYDAARLAEQGDVMVVTVNYRLGVFGYLSLPGLAGSGDFGLADQILATQWVKNNAAALGGDPGNLTVFGESSGAMSACALLGSPAAAGLVDKVAMSSGSCLLSWPTGGLLPGTPAQTPYLDLADAAELGTTEAKTLGCTGSDSAVLACLRGKPLADLMKIFPTFADVLAYNTPLLPLNPAQAVTEGKTVKIPVLSGGNQTEERAFVSGVQAAHPVYTAKSYPVMIKQAFGSAADQVLARYPLSHYPSPGLAFAGVITDSSWSCPTLAGNAALAAHGTPVFGYEFADPNPPNVNGTGAKDVPTGPAHATDVPYLFDLGGKDLLTSSAQKTLSTKMIAYWTSFARTGSPVAAGGASWPALTGTSGPTLQLGPDITTADVGAEHQCAFWSGLRRS